ncbi:MAG: phospholipid carrier-dependent glycosyltransferase, partial [Candidatus Limnocylindrales bacterium]
MDETPRRGLGWQILTVLVIGLIFRLMMAYGFPALRGSGFDSDLNLFRYWAQVLAEHGPGGFYANASYADYTPGYLYALWPVGIVGGWLGGIGDLIKLPAIITDVVLAFLVYRLALDLKISERRATIAAAVVVLNPITWFDSVVWGQVDSFGTVFLLLSIRELWKNRFERAAILAVVAALVKPQLGILVPIIAVVTIRRVLWPAGGFGDEDAPTPSGFGWERRTTGVIRIASTAVAGFVTAVAMAIPFGLSVISLSTAAPFVDSSLLRLVLSTAATYPYLTVNAYNAWALFPVDGQSMMTTPAWILDSAAKAGEPYGAIGPFPAALVGAVLLLGIAAVISLLVARRPDRLTILVGVCALALAFFAVPTRVHERYLFPLFGLAAILLAFSWRWRILYALASVATFLNMYVVLTTLYPNNPSIDDWLGIGDAIRSGPGVLLVALVNTGALVFGLLQLRDAARHRLAAELERGRVDDPAEEPVAAGAIGSATAAGRTGLGLAGAGAPASVGVAGAASAPAATATVRRIPAWFDRPSWTELGPIAWLRNRTSETPIRPDRSRLLVGERGGRLDRLDLWILIVLVVAGMGLRMFRLAEPARMHFDEVYHARTAAEFLQDWRYGISHGIYEWTHPHLAKYAMAAGIVAFAGHDVAATSELGVPVRDAVIEPRRADPLTTARAGDRVWVATGSSLNAYDLETRKLVARIALPGASAVEFDADGLQLYVATDTGQVLGLDTSAMDQLRVDDPAAAPDQLPVELTPLATLGAPVLQLSSYDGGAALAARLPDDQVVVLDPGSGEERARLTVTGAADLAPAGNGDAIVATPASVTDAAALATELAGLLGGDAATYSAQLDTDAETVVMDAILTTDVRDKVTKAIADGGLTGVAIDQVGMLAVAGADGVSLVSGSGVVANLVVLDGGATSVVLVTGVDDGSQLYATTTDTATGNPEVAVIAATGTRAKDGPDVDSTFRLPGAGSRIVYDSAAEMVEVLGLTPDGTGSTIYVVEPHGKSVFADHRLSFAPSAWVLDHNEKYPTDNRGAILAFSDSGTTASADIGHYHFSWRLPGVILGALTIAVLYLLGRILFRRREVAVLVGLFVLLDGMFFVQSRIAMNDVYTGFFILSAYLLFAWLWLERRRARAFWLLMPAIGVLLGLALASKWVAAYAIGALGILVLVRSALGRLILIAGLVGVTGVLGWMAMAVPANSQASGNLLFTMIMVALTLAAVVVTIYHPIAWSDDEVRLAVGGPAAIGILLALGSIAVGKANAEVALGPVILNPLSLSFGLVLVGGLAYAAFQVSGRYGMGPMAMAPEPGSAAALVPPPGDPAEGWLRLGSGLGLPMAWMVVSLIAIPLAVYVVLYVPWALIDNHQLVTGWPAGNTGQTLVDLTGEMYRYHNNLTAAHAASSPWWAWPLNLKPVWFYQGS